MPPREIDVLRSRLDAVARAANDISSHAEDLYSLGYDSATGDGEPVSGNGGESRPPPAGDFGARRLLFQLNRHITEVERVMMASQSATLNMLMSGPSAPETRGSLIKKAELKAQINRQRRRREAGDYTPVRMVDQPVYPGK